MVSFTLLNRIFYSVIFCKNLALRVMDVCFKRIRVFIQAFAAAISERNDFKWVVFSFFFQNFVGFLLINKGARWEYRCHVVNRFGLKSSIVVHLFNLGPFLILV